MGTQEVKLKAIADAIREKDGTAAPIPAADFPDRIRAISTTPEGLHTITVEANDPDGGTVSGGGVASGGMVLTVEAVTANGYNFSGWQEGGTTVSTAETYTFTATGDRTLVAAFEETSQYVSGVDWWASNLPVSAYWYDVTYGNGKFVAISGYTSNITAYSTDGINWTTGALPSFTKSWQSVVYGDGKFVAVASNVSKAAYSTDGVNWTETTLPSSANWTSVTFGDGKFVAIASGTSKAAYSADGIRWTAATLPSSASWSITYGNRKFVTVAYNSNKAAYSTDGVSWTAISLPAFAKWKCVTHGDGKFVAIAGVDKTKTAAYSADGIHWTATTLPSFGDWHRVICGDRKFVAFVQQGTTAAYSSRKGPGV